MKVNISAIGYLMKSTGEPGYATVSPGIFGGINVNKDPNSTLAFVASIEALDLTLLRWPGGAISENGEIRVGSNGEPRIFVSGGDPLQWASATDPTASNYIYDLSYPDLVHPLALANNPDIVGLSGAIEIARQSDIGIEIIIPTVRYSGFGLNLTEQSQRDLAARFNADVAKFLDALFLKGQYGELPDEVMIDIGNENLVWTTKYDGEVLSDGKKYDPQAVEEAIGAYFRLMEEALIVVKEIEAANPEIDIKIAIQLPFMNNQSNASDDPQDVFLQFLNSLPVELLAEIDVLRFHALTLDMADAANYENWFSDEIARASQVINEARTSIGGLEPIEVAVSAWSVDGSDVLDGPSSDTSLAAAGAAIAAIASFAEMGVDYAAAWGFAIPYMPNVQLSRYDENAGQMVNSPAAEAIRQMSETLPGAQLLTPRQYIDAGRVGPANIQAFGTDSTIVIFVSANDIQDGDEDDTGSAGELVTINIADLGGEIGYAWVETINVASGVEGEAVVWNPLLDDRNVVDRGEMWISFSGNELTIRLTADYQVARIIVSRAQPGISPVYLIGDSRRGSGVTSDRLLGGSGNDSLYGLSDSDTIISNAGDDLLDGGEGHDRLFSGIGNDTIFGGFGNDTITGDGGNDLIYGGGGGDSILGGTGEDLLDGGNGADTLNGGDGDDVYYVDAFDEIFEGVGGGVDRVEASFTYILGLNLESLTLTGLSDINGIGNELNNNLAGNSAANKLMGGAGNDTLNGNTGSDTLVGGIGDDIYYTDGGDTLIESASAGTDTVFASVSYILMANFENLTLTGSGSLSGTGNALNNLIIGNGGRNILNGGAGSDILIGGGGEDTLIGATGNDTYYTDGGDTLLEVAGEGTDSVFTWVSYSLAANIENLFLKADADLSGTGNDLDNLISGNSGNNALSGSSGADTLMGGSGNDTLIGGMGADILIGGYGADAFVFDAALDGDSVDTIDDFNTLDDTFVLSRSVFTGLASGALPASAFLVSSSPIAASPAQRIIYESDTGILFFDADGNGPAVGVAFAITQPGLLLTGVDFFVL